MPPTSRPSAEIEIFSKLADDRQPRNLTELRAVLDAAEAAAARARLDPASNDLVRVYNRSRKQYTHDKFVSAPQAFITLPRYVAEKWLSMFPEDFVAGDEALRSVDASAAEAAEQRKLNEELTKEKAALASDLEAARAQINLLLQGKPKGGPSGD